MTLDLYLVYLAAVAVFFATPPDRVSFSSFQIASGTGFAAARRQSRGI